MTMTTAMLTVMKTMVTIGEGKEEEEAEKEKDNN